MCFAAHPYRCAVQVEHAAHYINIAGHGTVVIAESHAPITTVKSGDIIDPAASTILRSHGVPAEKERKEEKGNKKEKRDCTGTTNTACPPA